MEFMLASEGVEADDADEDWPCCGGRGCIGGRGMLDAEAEAAAAAFGGMGGGVADDDESDEEPELPPLLPTK